MIEYPRISPSRCKGAINHNLFSIGSARQVDIVCATPSRWSGPDKSQRCGVGRNRRIGIVYATPSTSTGIDNGDNSLPMQEIHMLLAAIAICTGVAHCKFVNAHAQHSRFPRHCILTEWHRRLYFVYWPCQPVRSVCPCLPLRLDGVAYIIYWCLSL